MNGSDYDDYDDDLPADLAEEPEDALTGLGAAADRLRVALEQETSLARHGGLRDFAEAVRAKRAALADFQRAVTEAEADPDTLGAADGMALRRLLAMTEENALILEAVKNTIDDFSTRLRRALTSAADPGTYGPNGRGPRHAMAAQYDTKI